MNAAQKLWERLGLPASMGPRAYTWPTKYANAKRRHFRRPPAAKATYATAMADASNKYDTPRRKRPKPANGVKETDHELRRRMNWLRERIAELPA